VLEACGIWQQTPGISGRIARPLASLESSISASGHGAFTDLDDRVMW
jgi:hypothetical protein